MLSNRESARRSRHRKAMQVKTLEEQVYDLKKTLRASKQESKQLRRQQQALKSYTQQLTNMVRGRHMCASHAYTWAFT